MFGPNTLLNVYLAPKDSYTFATFKNWHKRTKRRWRQADIYGGAEVRVIENNRRHNIKYVRPLKIFGWVSSNVRYEKSETTYQDVVGDPYYDYFTKFIAYVLDWWGVGGRFRKKGKKERNPTSIPNSPMLDVSVHFDTNSFMEKIYLQGMGYEAATETTFKGKSTVSELITDLTKYHKEVEGMDDDKAYHEAMRLVEIVQRNRALDNNSPTKNEYNFMLNYFNKFIDEKIREMMKISINFWFLKEAMTQNPNLSFYVLGPFNRLMRIQGIVSKRGQNIVVGMSQGVNTSKYDYEFYYSLDADTLINESERGFIPAKNLKKEKSKIKNLLWGNRPLKVEHRYNNETFYDLVLEGPDKNNAWFDALHNAWAGVDYSNPINLKGKDIIC